jgi:hypothetical protein
MTRALSDLLGAQQPRFGITIQQLEVANGNKSIDIRLSNEILQRTRRKLQDLNLDPQDTTGEELYQALMERFGHDEKLAQKTLGLSDGSTPAEIIDASVAFVKKIAGSQTALTLKNSVTKQLLKKVPPKKAMKQLGYRSLDSMLKHEAVPQLYMAAFLCESLAWRKKFLEQYTKLQPNNFELRSIEISVPDTARWNNIAQQLEDSQTPIAVFKELGAIVVLKIDRPTTVIQTVSLVVSGLNDIQSASSFLKLQQMKPDFGTFVHTIAEDEPLTRAELMQKTVPWRVVHQYYARFKDAYNALIFEPHIHPDDLRWLHPESLLENIHPALNFWHDTGYTAHLRQGEKVSLNIFDVSRNYLAKAPYVQQTSQALRQSLWQELMIRYLDQKNVEKAIAGDLATEPVFAELDDI